MAVVFIQYIVFFIFSFLHFSGFSKVNCLILSQLIYPVSKANFVWNILNYLNYLIVLFSGMFRLDIILIRNVEFCSGVRESLRFYVVFKFPPGSNVSPGSSTNCYILKLPQASSETAHKSPYMPFILWH